MAHAHITPTFLALAPRPAPEQTIEYQDVALSGFLLIVRASGLRTFALRYRDANGARRQHRIGRYPNIDTASARQEAERLLRYMSNGLFPIKSDDEHLKSDQRDAVDKARMLVAGAIGGSASWWEIRICDEVRQFDAACPYDDPADRAAAVRDYLRRA